MTALAGAIGAVLVAAITALGSWLLARRKSSGTVDTTQAETLWEESRAMRAELRDQVAALNAVIHRLNDELDEGRAETARLRAEVAALRAELHARSVEIDELKRGHA